MALTSIPTVTSGSSTAGPQPELGIYLAHYNSTNQLSTVFYTVPEGRKFEGYQNTNSDNYSYGSMSKMTGAHTNSKSMTPIVVRLTAGQSFKSGDSQYAYHYLWGVESDA